MFVYLYDKNTKEYLTSMEADKDPEETLLQGKFVPLLPANSTLMVPPVYNLKNEIPVYKNEKWVIEADYRKNFYKVIYEDYKTGLLNQNDYLIRNLQIVYFSNMLDS